MRFELGRSCLAGSIQIDTIKWLTAKTARRRYGEMAVPDATVNASIGGAIEKGRERMRRLREG
ncbi:hypothetical protein [Reyranella sp.]|uniref:hypothetical protein n=1 Tax=Reyranella sp. TaxID=1929291 RepID=UPI000BCC65A7|nr:hypothetical protein [Reyranella sp.]OYY37126.1 MAG: hypothetical protein B7Y57_22995 [Rhodospirillales bacterium 35-66-84]